MRIKKGYLLGLLLSLFIFILGPLQVAAGDAPKITIDALNQKLDNPEVVILDVRETKDWEGTQLKIKGAVREEIAAFNSWADKYPKGKTLVTYCA